MIICWTWHCYYLCCSLVPIQWPNQQKSHWQFICKHITNNEKYIFLWKEISHHDKPQGNDLYTMAVCQVCPDMTKAFTFAQTIRKAGQKNSSCLSTDIQWICLHLMFWSDSWHCGYWMGLILMVYVWNKSMQRNKMNSIK